MVVDQVQEDFPNLNGEIDLNQDPVDEQVDLHDPNVLFADDGYASLRMITMSLRIWISMIIHRQNKLS